jgi:hypothetical protein
MYGQPVRVVWIVIGGVGMGVLVVLGVAALVGGASDTPDPTPRETIVLTFPPVEHDPRAAEDLVVAWNRWRTATFVSSGTWTRTLDGSDQPLTGDVYTAQDPPRRLVLRLGAITEQIDGDVTICDEERDGLIVPVCTQGAGGRSYEDRVRAEMSLVLRYVIGDDRIYDVAEVDGCYRVELLPAALRSPWGRAARFCFDEESGALRSSEVRRQSAVDVERTVSVRTDVTEADF